MNYRHIYHAGNFADVFKHGVLALILEHLKRKDTPFRVYDTHAGIGRYDLSAVQANKTGEYRDGILRLMEGEPIPELAPYLAAVAAENPQGGIGIYPGSPRVARHLLRPQDKLVLVELHPEDCGTLKRLFGRDAQTAVHHMDAYTALKALLPPPERRGLVLIDPPFEVRDEFDRILKGVAEALRRWKTGIYAIWYPIKGREPVDRFLDRLGALADKAFTAEMLIHGNDDPTRLNGCGIAVLNPPWQLDEVLQGVLPQILDRLDAPEGRWRLDWISTESA
ncbi:23S rRNA (adenine(2030)-N(6))-methyltransferase RlmJ [Telmatospirillum sp. J64-1]|uniref:23S rRNA (adenine(2030)-N(6))-methyltransferase RlmJ n=1 Tax=Telmatospirillum sp. J64-1 TaxID=2502183 RepID=UPI00115E1911|nr:23S rRNA (adenine(2030)-N(6))-methyltransferase RlmJ [Telmatospirillum sp. J64-1]